MTPAERLRHGSLRGRLLFANLALAAVVLVVFALVTIAVVSLRSSSVQAERSARTLAAATALEKSVLDLETGARGFALTRLPRFLEPWKMARRAIPDEVRRLRRDAAGDRQAAAIDRGVRAYLTEFSVPFVAATRRRAPSRAELVARTSEGKRRVDALRGRFDALFATERRRGEARAEQAARRRDLALGAIGAGVVLLLGFVVLQQLALRRWVLEPLDRLGAVAGRLRQGDLTARAGELGGTEVDRVARSFDDMAATLEERSADLERSNAELEEFAYVASHDLAEPLRAMGGYADLLGRRYGDRLDDRAQRYIDGITSGAERMRGLIDDLLAYSRAGRRELHLDEVDVGAVLETVRGDLQVVIRESGAEVAAEGELPLVRTDAGQLRVVLQNLVANAIKFRAEAAPRVTVAVRPEGEEWRFDVRDNGIGIEPRHAERIFRMFQRLHTREEYEGTGIGLALCQRVVGRQGGRIWVASDGTGGSVFSFTLPRDPG